CIFHCTVSVKLRKQIQSATIDDQDIFLNINTVSLATVDCVLRRNTLRIKQVARGFGICVKSFEETRHAFKKCMLAIEKNCKHACMHAHTHTCTHAHAHARTHTYAHTHVQRENMGWWRPIGVDQGL